jgi:hypothetical protein
MLGRDLPTSETNLMVSQSNSSKAKFYIMNGYEIFNKPKYWFVGKSVKIAWWKVNDQNAYSVYQYRGFTVEVRNSIPMNLLKFFFTNITVTKNWFITSVVHSFSCPGSGSVLGECGTGSGSRSMEIDQILQIDLVSAFKKKAFVPSYVCFFLLSTLEFILHVKIQFFVTLKSDQRDPQWFGSLDPDPDPHYADPQHCIYNNN